MRKYRISAGIASVVLVSSLAVAGVALADGTQGSTAGAEAQTGQTSQEQTASTVSMANQTLGMESLGNARQLGGYVGKDGKTVKENVLLRTAKLADASQADLDKLVNEYNLGYVCDFRTSSEREQAPDPNIAGVENIWCSIVDEDSDLGQMASGANGTGDDEGEQENAAAGSTSTDEQATEKKTDEDQANTNAAVTGGQAADAAKQAADSQNGDSKEAGVATDNSQTAGQADSANGTQTDDAQAQQKAALETTVEQLVGYAHSMDLSTMYDSMADSEHSQQGYRQFFDVLLGNTDGKAVLWHCTAGKDRAGFGAALVLSALGVDRETILDDFALTNDFNAASIDALGSVAREDGYSDEDIEAVETLAGVNRDYMAHTLDHIDEAYGGMHDYLVNQIGLTDDEIAQLQSMYLE